MSAPRINIYSLKSRLIAWILTIFVLFAVAFAVLTFFTNRWISEKITDTTVTIVQQTNHFLSFLFQKAREIGFIISTNDSLVDLANFNPELRPGYYEKFSLVESFVWDLMLQAEMNQDISTIYVYFDAKGEMITSNMVYYSGQFFPEVAWLDNIVPENNAFQWVSHFRDEGLTDRNFLSLICRADIIDRDIRGKTYISINFDESTIYDILSALTLTQSTKVLLLDTGGRIVSASDKSTLGRHVADILGSVSPGDITGKLTIEELHLDEKYLSVSMKLPETGWQTLVLLPKRELFAEQKLILYSMIAVITFITAVLFIYSSLTIVRQVNRPVHTLLLAMERAEEGNFAGSIEETRNDEFGYLYTSYNRMVARIDRLIRELYHEKLLKRDIELKFLQRQINPHFLYNTLDTINWIARKHGIQDISRIVISLSQLYRCIFNKGRDFIEVRHVMEAMDSYLFIQRFRCPNLVEHRFDIEEVIRERLILNLIIQPIVENSVIHGIADCDRECFVEIRAWGENGILRFSIRDNGSGMERRKLELINRSIRSDGDVSTASGLRNVQKRIELVYGPEYGVSITSKNGEGTVVDITVPLEPVESRLSYGRDVASDYE